MEALKSLRRVELLEIARLAGIPNASAKTKQQLVEAISALNLLDVRRDALVTLARHLGLKSLQRASKSALARSLTDYIRPKKEALVEKDRQAASEVWEINQAISSQLLAGSKISSELSTPPVQDISHDLGLEQLRVTRSKFSPGIRHHLLIDQEARLPDHYDVDRAVLLVRDPFWLFLYWEITSETLARSAARGYGENVIRLHDVTGLDPFGDRSRSHLDFSSGAARSWYLSVPGDDRDYRAEVGCSNKRGEFLALLRSNTVSTPPARISSRADDRFMTMPFDRSLRPSAQRPAVSARSRPGFDRYSANLHLRMARLSVPGSAGEFDLQTATGRAGLGHLLSGQGGEASSPSGDWASRSKTGGSLWFQLGPDYDLFGEVDPGDSVRVNGESVQLDARGRFHVHLNASGEGAPMIAHSSGQGKNHDIIVQWRKN